MAAAIERRPSRSINDVDTLYFPGVTMKYLCQCCCSPAIQTESAYFMCFLIYYVNVLPGSTCFGLFLSYKVAPSVDWNPRVEEVELRTGVCGSCTRAIFSDLRNGLWAR